MGIDRSGEGDDQLESLDVAADRGPRERDADVPSPPRPELPADRAAYFAEYKKAVDAEYRAYAIDQGCARVEKIEKDIVTPAMRRIESEDSGRELVGLEFRLKERERLSEKVAEAMRFKGRTAEQAFAEVKDAIRYTFQYPDDRYSDGVIADCERLKAAGFEAIDRKNSWTAEEYKGINSRWLALANSQVFEVQFHTQASFAAKQETHSAYERLRSGGATDAERDELKAYQRRVSSMVPVPPGVTGIDNYDRSKRDG